MKIAASESTSAPATAWHADWLAGFGPRDRDPGGYHLVRAWNGDRSTLSVSRAEGSDLRIAEDSRFIVIFSGMLTNARELRPGSTQGDCARLVLERLGSHGVDALSKLRGPFAVLAWDREHDTLIVGRDHIGMEPLYYSRIRSDRWLFSPSPDVLTRQPGVSAAPDAVALSEWICGWYPSVEDTSYRDVKRVPPATAISIRGAETTFQKYWDPFSDEKIRYLGEEALDEFEPLLQRAVGRCVNGLPSSILLSGGVDSISVAVAATDVARAAGAEPPLALSLGFPDKVSNEEPIQRGVASQLRLDQVLLPFDEAVGPNGLIAESLSMSAGWPLPMWNIWSPGYMTLARHAAARGRRVALTGRGGDEWLTISPYLLADQLKQCDVAGAWKLLQMHRRSNGLATLGDAARFVWNAGCRPLASGAFDLVAPALWHRRRRRRLLSERPDWIAPDAAIRRAMDERVDRWIQPARPAGGFYQRECRNTVGHPGVTQDMEETQEFGRRSGLRMLHPYWDVDLVTMLHRIPPALLMSDGRSKSIVRRRVSQRLPGLGLDQRVKVSARGVFRSIMAREAPRVWQRMGGLQALARIGVVSSDAIQSARWEEDLSRGAGGGGRLWTLMNFESWVRPRV